jgi:hypothetical protein
VQIYRTRHDPLNTKAKWGKKLKQKGEKGRGKKGKVESKNAEQ